MQKKKIFIGVLVLALGGSSLWTALLAKGSPVLQKRPFTTAGAAMMGGQTGGNTDGQNKSKKESPFACNMLALDAEGRRRHKTVTEQMRAAIQEVQELPDGYGFRFPAEQSTILLTSEFIARERLCCPFFTFELVAEQEDGPLWLRLRGREGVKNFIKAELGIK